MSAYHRSYITTYIRVSSHFTEDGEGASDLVDEANATLSRLDTTLLEGRNSYDSDKSKVNRQSTTPKSLNLSQGFGTLNHRALYRTFELASMVVYQLPTDCVALCVHSLRSIFVNMGRMPYLRNPPRLATQPGAVDTTVSSVELVNVRPHRRAECHQRRVTRVIRANTPSGTVSNRSERATDPAPIPDVNRHSTRYRE
ncbi:hypothetical protein J6590_017431 [Homalodisca vitripennis]|nr:hypothetical protein J6590_017431 [Homalodisca vitripennis]